ncbi:hypothetical protein [Cohnella abietis]|uniref:Uncharacterized protein n=1 Tax=Cohnella abietis TaxID=2507935 RepID=A0A3T1D0Q9_9BACL|nr:hypothetical protein [Cohnella abietis]BBI31693.1 hypothetical protein KCTCHS21_10920 [Cohnella abietis]
MDEMYDNFEQLGHEEARMEGDARNYRAMGSRGSTILGRCTIISSNWVMGRHDWSEILEIIEQRGHEEAR